MKNYKTFTACLILALFIIFPQPTFAAQDFNDIPKTHWAYNQVMKLRELGITSGVGDNNFGTGRNITRAEFATMLENLMRMSSNIPIQSTYNEHMMYYDQLTWFFKDGPSDTDDKSYRPKDNITREEMAIMLVCRLGLDFLTEKDFAKNATFSDVKENVGYISIAKDLGIVSGTSATTFSPKDTATREQAAAMMVRVYDILQNKPDELNGFYAIRSSNQMAAIDKLDTVSFGWAALETDGASVWINITNSGGNEYNIPAGYEKPWEMAVDKNRLLMIAVKDEISSLIINTQDLSKEANTAIQSALRNGIGEDKLKFDGIVLDFETLKGEKSRTNYTEFVKNLRGAMPDELIYIAVHPARFTQEYYDGYDFRTLGQYADKIILMAHDYNPKILTAQDMAAGIVMTPVAPLDWVYDALRAITDAHTGVEDRDKIMLQISFSSCQWKLQDGKVINSKPYTPDYSAILNRIQPGAKVTYSYPHHQSPYLTFYNEEDNTDNVIWYENEQSVKAKMDLALLFGIKDFSFWRIGTIPDFKQENLTINASFNVYDVIFK